MERYLRYKAGPKIIDMVREESLRPERVKVFAGPAGGPKWFVSAGFDRALIRARFLHNGGRVLLAGSSAGGWRCLTMACKNPLDAYERLRIAYSRNVFSRQDTPETVSAAFRENVASFLSDDDLPSILDHEVYDLAVHTVRARGAAASENRKVEGGALLAAGVTNAISSAALGLFFERVVFFSGPRPPAFIEQSFKGKAVRLTRENLRMVALATGSLPYFMRGVDDIPGAPKGVYRDGGVADYQLCQDYRPGPDAVTLFFHYQERIVPGWFDKLITWRKPARGSLDRVLQVHPGEHFINLLPEKRLPDRNDFVLFIDDPAERIRRWDTVSELSERLGEQFMEDVDSGKIRDLVQPLTR